MFLFQKRPFFHNPGMSASKEPVRGEGISLSPKQNEEKASHTLGNMQRIITSSSDRRSQRGRDKPQQEVCPGKIMAAAGAAGADVERMASIGSKGSDRHIPHGVLTPRRARPHPSRSFKSEAASFQRRVVSERGFFHRRHANSGRHGENTGLVSCNFFLETCDQQFGYYSELI